METSTIIIYALIAIISIILILSVVKMSARLDELSAYVRRIMEIEEKKNRGDKN